MAEPKVTIMVLKVDLQCPKCYKKVKKVLCKFPQIRDQVYDEKTNKVTITVVCCNPEKIRDKLCCKGCGSIKSIEIVEPPPPKPNKPKEPEKKPEKPKEPEKKPKEPEKKPDKPAEGKPKPPPEKPKEAEKPKPDKPKPPAKQPEPAAPPPQPAPPQPAPPPPQPAPPALPPPEPVCPPAPYPPTGFCCTDCYHGHIGGPCYQGYGQPTPYGIPVYDSWGGGGGYRTCYTRCDYFSEENSQGCSIM